MSKAYRLGPACGADMHARNRNIKFRNAPQGYEEHDELPEAFAAMGAHELPACQQILVEGGEWDAVLRLRACLKEVHGIKQEFGLCECTDSRRSGPNNIGAGPPDPVGRQLGSRRGRMPLRVQRLRHA